MPKAIATLAYACVLGACLWVIVFSAGALVFRSCRTEPGPAPEARTVSGVSLPADEIDPSTNAVGAVPPQDSSVADARPSSGERDPGGHHLPEEPPGIELGTNGSGNQSLAASLSRYEFSEPRAEDILWLTIELWSQPEFLELTEQEAHDLLPLDDTIGLKGPTSLLSVIGPLPTIEDCARGFAAEDVKVALQQVLVLEAVITELGMVPRARRDVLAEARIEEAVRLRDAAALELMRRMEEASGYPNWRTWWSLYRRWSE